MSKVLKNKYLIVYSIIFSFLQVIGYNANKYDSARLNNISTYLYTLSLSLIIFLALFFISKIEFKDIKTKYIDNLFNKKYSFIILLLLILLAWLIPLYALYPGNFAYDAGTQLRMVQFNVLTKYHPVMHTFFLYIPIVLGGRLFNSYDIGLLLHSIIQMLIMGSIFSYTLIYLYKKKFNPILLIIFLLIYMFLPTHSVFAISTTKDVVFSGLFNLVFILFYELSTNTEKFLSKKRNIVITIIMLFLLFSFRNNMIYAFIVFIPFILVLLKKNYKKILLISLSSILLFYIYDISLTKVFKINNGPRVEMFSFVTQQFATVYNKEDLSKEDKESIEKLYLNNALERYNSHINDPSKNDFNSEELLNNKSKYLKLYLKLGMKYPLTYVDSIINTTYGLYYLDETLPQPGTKSYMGVQCLSTENNSFFGSDDCDNSKYLRNVYYNLLEKASYKKIPILNILMNMGVYCLILIFSVCYLIHKKDKYRLIPILLVSLYISTNILAPAALVRYMYPLFTLIPLIIFVIYNKKEN